MPRSLCTLFVIAILCGTTNSANAATSPYQFQIQQQRLNKYKPVDLSQEKSRRTIRRNALNLTSGNGTTSFKAYRNRIRAAQEKRIHMNIRGRDTNTETSFDRYNRLIRESQERIVKENLSESSSKDETSFQLYRRRIRERQRQMTSTESSRLSSSSSETSFQRYRSIIRQSQRRTTRFNLPERKTGEETSFQRYRRQIRERQRQFMEQDL